jgi:hypothetical protein
MSKQKAIVARASKRSQRRAAARASSAVTVQEEKKIEVFMYVRLSGLVRVYLEHEDIERAKAAAADLCSDMEENLEISRFERISSECVAEGGVLIDCAELVELVQDFRRLEPPEFWALKVNGKFVEGRDPDVLPAEFRS